MPDRSTSRTVYTTESGRICPDCGQPIAACRCKKKGPRPPAADPVRGKNDGVVRVFLERKGRGGSTVSVITGLSGAEETLKELASALKRHCGTGGTLKNGSIEIQGDHRDAIIDFLKTRGISAKRAGG